MKEYSMPEIEKLARETAHKLALISGSIGVKDGDVRDIMWFIGEQKFSEDELLFIAAQFLGNALHDLGAIQAKKMFE